MLIPIICFAIAMILLVFVVIMTISKQVQQGKIIDLIWERYREIRDAYKKNYQTAQVQREFAARDLTNWLHKQEEHTKKIKKLEAALGIRSER